MCLGLFRHNFAMNYICLCEDTSNHYPFHYCGSSPASSDDKDTITKTKNALCYMVYARAVQYGKTEPYRTEPNRNRQYGLVLVYTI